MNNTDLKQWREANGLTQKQLAQILGVRINSVSNWERGLRGIHPWIPRFLELWQENRELKEKIKSMGCYCPVWADNQQLKKQLESTKKEST